MEKVATLGGVCSGEHGIGVTKLKYLDPAVIRELNAYRREADPQGLMNPGKLTDLREVACIYTPSFNLLELEARILQYGKMEELAVKIANCVRCGKCKPDCCVFHPARGLFYHPRNKNLAVGALIEALLYEAQRSRSAGFGMLRYLEDVADHCTICHKCVKPCPVAIDTGDVSVLEREILVAHGFKHTPPAVKATLLYLESRSPTFNKIFRFGVVRLGGAVQRLLSAFVKSSLNPDKPAPYPLQILRSPVPPASPQALWNDLPACTAQQTLTFEPNGECSGTVFYFPGCGSERLFSDISAAAVQVLTELKNRVVLAPPYLCCGFPHHANARRDRHDGILLRDTIIFSQIREMFSYLEFDAVTVTCGTCLEALRHMEVEKLFDAPLWDVTRYAAEKGLSLRTDASECLYHAPCHDSLEGKAAATLEQIGGIRLRAVPHCCSEAGTLALSRPDIGDAMLHRKTQALKEALTERGANAPLLTNCPSCLQGLGRNVALGVKPKHIVVELAERLSGPNWRASFRVKAAKAAPIRF
jgi:Fe-S oxidoreductase